MIEEPERGTEEADALDDEHRERRAALLHEGPPMQAGPPWILTFADLISQLIGLLILILTFASFEPARFDQLAGSVREVFGRETHNTGPAPSSTPETVAGKEGAAPTRQGILDGMKAIVHRHGGRLLGGQVDVEVFESYRGVVLRIGQVALFDPQEDGLRPAAWPFLDAVQELAVERGGGLEIEVRVPASPGLDSAALSGLAGRRGLSLVRYLLGREAGLGQEAIAVRAIGLPEDAAALPTAGARLQQDRVDLLVVVAPEQVEAPP